jgi:release factor glutamine methyltransferase
VTTVAQGLAAARQRLAASSDSAALDGELLLGAVLGLGRAQLLAQGDRLLTGAEAAAFETLLARRQAGEPVAYLTGSRGFWTLELRVTPAVLVPRPETELLVEMALGLLPQTTHSRVLDLGTGSGAVALALAVERPGARIDAVEASAAAAAVARGNAGRVGTGNVEIHTGHWFAPVADRYYRVIVGNPPYLAANDPYLPGLAHEPREALVAGPTGLEAIAEICAAAPAQLEPGGWLLLEHGAGQGAAVRGLFAAAGLSEISTRRDLAGLERVTVGCWTAAGPAAPG